MKKETATEKSSRATKKAASAPAKKPAVKKTESVEKSKKAAVKKTAKPASVEKDPVSAEPVKKPVSAAKTPAKAPAEKTHRKLKLTKTQQKHYIGLLMELRHNFLNQIQFHQDEALSSKKDAAGERAGMATHMADLGSDNFRHDIELGLMTEEGDVLEMIDEALQKIQDREYGICVECGCAINPERLEAKPYARFCIRCKNKLEQQEDPHRRHR